MLVVFTKIRPATYGSVSLVELTVTMGNPFRIYIINGDVMNEDRTGKTFSDRPPYGINSIIEDKTGKFWFGTRGNTFVYDGKIFSVFTNKGNPFIGVGTIIENKRGEYLARWRSL